MRIPELPENVARINPGESFSFLCHKDISCFTDCCRQLELALTPYDILRLRYGTNLSSADLLEKYIITEQYEGDMFPRFYLTMVDDGHGSCVFVTDAGCSLYQHRPGACRTYPMGRGVTRDDDHLHEFYVLLHEPHCLGFREQTAQTINSFSKSQDLATYNHFNDLLLGIQQHPKVRNGMKLNESQISDYTLSLYDIDTFRQKMSGNPVGGDTTKTIESLDDEALLTYSFNWLKKQLFGQSR